MTAEAVRRRLWYGFAALWSVDALLKLQPRMFSPRLFIDVLGPVAADSQPAWFARWLALANGVWVHHIVAGDAAVFAVEAAIALLLWRGEGRNAGRAGLWLAMIWSVAVWVFGEGVGGLVTGDASWLAEAPGATVVYVAIAALLLLPENVWRSGKVADGLRYGLGLFWLAGAAVQAQASFWTGPALGAVFGNVTMNGQQPVLVARILNAILTSVVTHPVPWNAVLTGSMVALALLYALRAAGVWHLAVSLVWLAFIWATAEAFGNLGTGTATDPGQVVPLALVSWAASALAASWPKARAGTGRGRGEKANRADARWQSSLISTDGTGLPTSDTGICPEERSSKADAGETRPRRARRLGNGSGDRRGFGSARLRPVGPGRS